MRYLARSLEGFAGLGLALFFAGCTITKSDDKGIDASIPPVDTGTPHSEGGTTQTEAATAQSEAASGAAENDAGGPARESEAGGDAAQTEGGMAPADGAATDGGAIGEGGGLAADAGVPSGIGDGATTDSGGAVVGWASALEAAKSAIAAGKTAIDLNGDGVPDYYRTLDGSVVVHEEIDADGDGTAELVWDYSRATKTFRRDDNHDGSFEEALDVTADTTDPSIVSYEERIDQNSDGSPNIVRKWTVDPSLDSVGIEVQEDTDGDGTLDWSISNTVPRLQNKFANVSTSGANACTADQAAKIEAAVDQAVEQAMGCLAANHPSLGLKLAKFLTNSNLLIRCDSSADPYCGAVNMADVSAPWFPWFGKRDAPITLDGPAFDPKKCGPLASTIFHEMMHYVNGLHQYGDGSDDPGDTIFSCEKMCFGVVAADETTSPASNLQCAACLGVGASSTKCDKFPKKPCPTPKAQCPCRKTLYADAISCSVGCPSGIGCFTARCRERGPCAQ